MHDHGVDDLDGGHDEPPVEIEVAGAGATPPSAFLVAEGNSMKTESLMLVEILQSVADRFLRLLAVKLANGFFGGSDPLFKADGPMQRNDHLVVLKPKKRPFV